MNDPSGRDPQGNGDRDRIPLPYLESRPFDALEHSFFDAGDAMEREAAEPAELTSVNLRPRLRFAPVLVVALGGLVLLAGAFSGSKISPAAMTQVAVAEAAIPPAPTPVAEPAPIAGPAPVSAPAPVAAVAKVSHKPRHVAQHHQRARGSRSGARHR